MRRSQRDHPVTGRRGSLQPIGQPIVQSVQAGFKVGPGVQRRSPFDKLTRQRWEEGKGAGVQPEAIRRSQNSVQATTAFLIPICLPAWLRSVQNFSPSGPTRMQALLPLPLKVGVGQNEEPFPKMRPADFRR